MKTELNSDKGQHFLTDKRVVVKEIKIADVNNQDKVIEIGAGNGILTEDLAENAGKVLAFEVDEKFKDELEGLKKRFSNLEVVYDDALKHDWRGYNKIVSNIPYFLAGDVVLKAIRDSIEEIVIITGEKFKYKLEKIQGKIGIIADLFFEVTPIAEIRNSSFSPPPKVKSWMIKLKRKKVKNKIEDILRRIILKQGKIKNAILYSFVEIGKTKNQAREIIKKMNIPEETLNKSVKMMTDIFIIKLKDSLLKEFVNENP